MSRQVKELSVRSYLATARFDMNFFTYKTRKDPVTFKTTGDLSVVTGANSSNCPAGRVLRENGRKLFPPAHPIDTVNGVAVTFPPTVMVGVFDNQSGLSGFIDPNSPAFAVYNTDHPNYLKDSVDPVGGLTDLGPPTMTRGSVNIGERLIMNSGNSGTVSFPAADSLDANGNPTFKKVTVNASNCKSTSKIMLTYAGLNTPGVLSAEEMSNAGTFKIVSTNHQDKGSVMYFIFN